MKKNNLFLNLSSALLLLMFISATAQSTIVNVNATSGLTFSPQTINVFVGDTVKWTRTGGSHTTTCDGQTFTSRPAGALPWNAPLTSGSPTFTYVITVAGTYNYICEPHAPSMSGVINATVSGITQLNEIAISYGISQNYPNPFNPETNIKFSIPVPSFVTLKVYNNTGKEIATLVNEKLGSASYEINWNASGQNSGVYYYRIQAGEFTQTRKMMLIK